MDSQLEALIIRKTLRVPLPAGSQGDGAAVARQLDSVLLGVGFKLSGDLMKRLSGLPSDEVLDLGARLLAVVRPLAGDHVKHNSYFKSFPFGVPDTVEFWLESLRAALLDPATAGDVEMGAIRLTGSGYLVDADDGDGDGKVVLGWVNLLSLPNYGTYQHTYEEMLAAHDEMIPAVSDRVTVLHAGRTLDEEAVALYLSLAGSTVPLSPEDLASLADLATRCLDSPQPDEIPVRENRAVINRVRLAARNSLLADTVTDVLRLACAASDGDVTLETPTRFRSFARPERRLILAALHEVVQDNPAKLGDVATRREPWKRLAERLHPHEHPQYAGALDVFAVARGDKPVLSFAARLEATMAAKGAGETARLLHSAPGLLWRSLDRLMREAADSDSLAAILDAASRTAPDVSGRVLLSVREHMVNRQVPTDVSRVFTNRNGRAWVTRDRRAPLDQSVTDSLADIIDAELISRLAARGPVLVDPAALDVALPLSGKAVAPGLGLLPRGSVSVIDGETLRFFVYWKQRQDRTDYDLSALLLDEDYGTAEHVSWTNYHAGGYATYSGDITDATDGATEFIDVVLPRTPRKVIIPQVHIYSGERFDEAEEAFFGFMVRSQGQKGAPFEARTVRMKSDLRGSGRVALPLAFVRGDDGKWRAKWLHLYLRGRPQFNLTEGNRVTTTKLTRAIMERDYLRVSYLTGLMEARGDEVRRFDGARPEEPVTFIGLERPDGLAEGSRVVTPQNLGELIPA